MPKSRLSIAIVCLLWAIFIGIGLYLLMYHEITPGAQPKVPPIKFPKDSKLKLSSDKDTLVMFVHPQCPCTEASLKQLSPLSLKQDLNIQLVHYKPSKLPDGWREEWQLEDWTKQKTVQVIEDSDGLEAKRFDARTSGQTFLFAPNGTLLFHGGITAARGVTGENEGFNNLSKALARDKTAEAQNPNLKKSLVFGCNLLNERN